MLLPFTRTRAPLTFTDTATSCGHHVTRTSGDERPDLCTACSIDKLKAEHPALAVALAGLPAGFEVSLFDQEASERVKPARPLLTVVPTADENPDGLAAAMARTYSYFHGTIDPEPASRQAMRDARAAYDERYPEGA
jgi:hypothetical protein